MDEDLIIHFSYQAPVTVVRKKDSDTENTFYDLTIFYVGNVTLQLQKRFLTSVLILSKHT